jgi:hypothetical protein
MRNEIRTQLIIELEPEDFATVDMEEGVKAALEAAPFFPNLQVRSVVVRYYPVKATARKDGE